MKLFPSFRPSLAYPQGCRFDMSGLQYEGTVMSQREPTTAVGEHIDMQRHKITEEEVTVLERESNTWHRNIREVVEISMIRTHQSEMNWDNGYDLPAMYTTFYSDTPRAVGV